MVSTRRRRQRSSSRWIRTTPRTRVSTGQRALRLLEERPGGGPAGIGQPGLGAEARQEREQRANARARVEDVGGQHARSNGARPTRSSGSVQSTVAISRCTPFAPAPRIASATASVDASVASTMAPARAAVMLGSANHSRTPPRRGRGAPHLRARASAPRRFARARTRRRHRRPVDRAVVRQLGGLPRLEHAEVTARERDQPADEVFEHVS